MRVTLIHNPTAGSDQPSAETLVGWLGAAGYDVQYASSKRKSYEGALEDPGNLVVVAGGDGTVAKIATRLVGRDIPLAVLPLGTSNNLAATLGVRGTPEEIIRALPTAEITWLDAGTARAPWGVSRFVESAGVGLFAAMLEHAERNAASPEGDETGEDPLTQSVRGTLRILDMHPARFYRLEADGVDLSGRYVLAVAMNIRRIGSTLELAPDADTADGKFDLVLLREEDRNALVSHLERLLDGLPAPFPIVPRRASVVRIGWDPAAGHLDDERWPKGPKFGAQANQERSLVELSIVDPPIAVLVGNAGGG